MPVKEKDKGKLEIRSFPMKVEIRSEGESPPRLVGYAAVFNELSEPIWGCFREKIRPGAFAKSIGKDDIRALWNHNPDFVLGRNRSGTLRLYEDERGLKIEITPPDTQQSRDLLESIRRGDVDQMSFGFRTLQDAWSKLPDDPMETRELIEVELFDVSPVTYPAYPQTSIATRSAQEILDSHAEAVQAGGSSDEIEAGKKQARAAKLRAVNLEIMNMEVM